MESQFFYLIIILLILSSIVLIWQFTGFPIFMAIVALWSKTPVKDYSYQPSVSILVPTFNEEMWIQKRMKNLLELDYPKDLYEIIIVDSGSHDSTVQIARDLIDKQSGQTPLIRLVTEDNRKGKASAINFGKKFARFDIVLITDANCIFSANVLKELMPHFKDPKVGIVGGRYFVLDPDSHIKESAQFYWDIEYIMRVGEAALDSACLVHGEIYALRKNIVQADTHIISEDLNIAIQIRRQGYKIEYEPLAAVYEQTPATAKDQITQRKKTAIGTIQNIFKNFWYFMVPKDFYSLIIFPSHKFVTMLSPFYLLVIPLLYIISGSWELILIHAISTLVVFVLSLGLLLHLKGKICTNSKGSSLSLSSILNIILYVLLNEYLVLLAWVDFASGKHSVLWEKAETTR